MIESLVMAVVFVSLIAFSVWYIIKVLKDTDDIWAKRALLYDNLDWAKQKDFLRFFIDSCDLRSNFAALDIGCGTGIVSRELAKKVRGVIAIDLSKDMIKQASEKDRALDLAPKYLQADAQHMKFPNSTFDLVTARMSFHHIEDVEKAMKEVYRVLRRGGRFVLGEGVPPNHRVRQRYEEIFALKEKRHTFSGAELINLFYQAGFENITLKPFIMQQVSLVKWLKDSALEDSIAMKILELHLNADEYFKKVYRMSVDDNDVFIDWKFVVVIGGKG